jgi:hypothetical protein
MGFIVHDTWIKVIKGIKISDCYKILLLVAIHDLVKEIIVFIYYPAIIEY